MFKGFNNRQQHGFPSLSFFGDKTAYGQGGCSFWLRADFGTNTIIDGARVSTWIDSIGGIILGQTTSANQPFYDSQNASFNNLPVIDFNAANTRLYTDATGVRPISNVRTFAIVANYGTIQSRNYVISNFNDNSGIIYGGTTTGINGVGVYESTTLYSGTTESTSAKITVITDNLIMVNGIVENNTSFNLQRTYNTIGHDSGTFTLRGNVAEIIGFSFPLNQDQALAISTQLNQKYVIY
jgi:hypothetical protein